MRGKSGRRTGKRNQKHRGVPLRGVRVPNNRRKVKRRWL